MSVFGNLLVCPYSFTNRASLELKSLLYLFCIFSKMGLSNWGAACTWTFTVYWSGRKFSWKKKQKFSLHEDKRDNCFVIPDPNTITLTVYEEIFSFQ